MSVLRALRGLMLRAHGAHGARRPTLQKVLLTCSRCSRCSTTYPPKGTLNRAHGAVSHGAHWLFSLQARSGNLPILLGEDASLPGWRLKSQPFFINKQLGTLAIFRIWKQRGREAMIHPYVLTLLLICLPSRHDAYSLIMRQACWQCEALLSRPPVHRPTEKCSVIWKQ